MLCTREHPGQPRADAFADGIGIGEDNNAAFFVGGANVLDRGIPQAKSVGDDAVRLNRTPHRGNIHLSLDNDDFFDHSRLTASPYSFS